MIAPNEAWVSLSVWFEARNRLLGERNDSRQGVACRCGAWADLVHMKDGEAEALCARCAEAEAP
jgi:hypothetical protein